MFFKHTALALAAGLVAVSAQAQVGVTADLGTTGAGVHLVVPMEAKLNGRFGINYFKNDSTRRSGLVNYEVNTKLQTFDALFDWYLMSGNSFRLTGGLVYNGTKAEARGTADSGTFRINGQTYSAADVGSLTGTVDFHKAAPYLGIGWGNALTPNKRWNFNTDLGAFYQGKGEVNLISRGCVGNQALCAALARDVSAEEARLNDDISDFKFYPVLRASLSYSF